MSDVSIRSGASFTHGGVSALTRLLGGLAVTGSVFPIAVPASAQAVSVPSAPQPPTIAASAIGETRITPDRAMLSVALETQGGTAAAAASDNARLQARIIDAVKAAGIPAAQIRTSGYNVYPEYSGGSHQR